MWICNKWACCKEYPDGTIYKGNFHLRAEIDGQERKFVIGKNMEEFSLIASIGIANLSLGQLQNVVEKYLTLSN